MNELRVHNFIFNIIAGIFQTFIMSWNQILYPRFIGDSRLPFELHDVMTTVTVIAVTVAWIQECGEKPMFHLQSQWSSENHIFPVRSA